MEELVPYVHLTPIEYVEYIKKLYPDNLKIVENWHVEQDVELKELLIENFDRDEDTTILKENPLIQISEIPYFKSMEKYYHTTTYEYMVSRNYDMTLLGIHLNNIPRNWEELQTERKNNDIPYTI